MTEESCAHCEDHHRWQCDCLLTPLLGGDDHCVMTRTARLIGDVLDAVSTASAVAFAFLSAYYRLDGDGCCGDCDGHHLRFQVPVSLAPPLQLTFAVI